MTNKEYIDVLLVTGKIKSEELIDLENVIHSNIDFKKYHNIVSKFANNLKEEIQWLEWLDYIYDKDYIKLDKFIKELGRLFQRFSKFNNNDITMIGIFRDNVQTTLYSIKNVNMSNKNLDGIMLRALKLFFNPRFIKLDGKLYYCSNSNDYEFSGASYMILQKFGLSVIEYNRIGFIGVKKDGDVVIDKVTSDINKLYMWHNIKDNIDDYDFIYVGNNAMNIDKFAVIVNYINDIKKDLSYKDLVMLERNKG